MHTTNHLVTKFLDDRESLSEVELGELADLITSTPDVAVELKQQLVLDELLAQRLAVDRQNFMAQVKQRIHDLKRGDEEMHRHIQELRTLASKELGQPSHYARSAMLLSAIGAVAVAILVTVGLRFWQPETLAVVSDSYGDAQVIRDGETQRVAKSDEVFVGDRFETSSQQALSVRYADDTVVQVDGASSVEFGNDDEVAGKRITIHRGSLAATVSPQAAGRPLVIRTEAAEAKVLGTQFSLMKQGNQTRLEVLEGRVSLAAIKGGSSQIVGSGQFGMASPTGVLVGNLFWPTTREGLAFLFETQDRGNLVRELSTGRLRSCRLTPRGISHLNSNFALTLHGGSYVARGVADDLLEAARRSGQFTILMNVTPAATSAGPNGVLASFASEPGQINFQLSQTAEQLQFQLRTRQADQDFTSQPTNICNLPLGQSSQLAVVYQPGRLICALNGQTVLNSEAIQGDLSNWNDGYLVFGSLLTAAQPWHGTLEGIAIYSRALAEQELAAQAQAYAQVLTERKVATRLEVSATVLELSPDPSMDDMAPEEAALRVDKYRVDQVLNGTLAETEIYVARWAILDSVPQAAPAVGQTQRLVLEPFAANPQLADYVCRDEFSNTSGTAPRYFLVDAF